MNYIALVYIAQDKLDEAPADECLEHAAKLGAQGKCIAAEALRAAHTATTLRIRNGSITVTDGPFAETKEHLAGFYLLQTGDLDEAVALASEIPAATLATIEIRPLVPPGWRSC